MIDLPHFHRTLLGRDPSKTPSEWQLHDVQKKLYEAFMDSGMCGYDSDDPDPLKLKAVLVLALAQTQGKREVCILTKDAVKCREEIETMSRHVFRIRKGRPQQELVRIKRAFSYLRWPPQVQRFDASQLWVAFGLTKQDPGLPNWIKEHLL